MNLEGGTKVNPVLTVVLGFIALGMVIYLTIRQYQRWKKKGKEKEEES